MKKLGLTYLFLFLGSVGCDGGKSTSGTGGAGGGTAGASAAGATGAAGRGGAGGGAGTGGMAGATLSDGAAAYEPFGFPRIPVDCNDVLALYRVGHEAVDRARIGYGPTLIDCVRYELEPSGNLLEQFETHMMRMNLLSPGESSQAARRVRSEQPTRRAASEPGVQLFIPS